ncbi:MAG: alpha/beta hydrolase [Proteobacteria bacterium]|nr:alpha/beta hydrolase [Pseudomonadota bacterium]
MASETEANFQESHIEVDGFQIRALAAGQGDNVVILDTMSWGLTRLHHGLARTNRVVVLELPGFGASAANDRSSSIKDLAGTMAQAAGKAAPGKFTLIGTSFAANVALWQALQDPDGVDALILISPTVIRPTDVRLPANAGDTGELARLLLAHPENQEALGSLDATAMAKEQDMAQRLQGPGLSEENEGRLGDVKCATLVAFGLNDRLVATQAGSIYREKIPNCHVSIVYDTGHAIVAERPEALIDAVSDYVERRETFIVGKGEGVINP